MSYSLTKDNLQEEIEVHQDQVYEMLQDRVICCPHTHKYYDIFKEYLKNRGTWTLNTLRQGYEFVDSPGTVISHWNYNKCHIFSMTSELKSATLSSFPSRKKIVICKDGNLHVLIKVVINIWGWKHK